MAIVDTVEAHQARCQPYLLTLRMIVHGEADPVLTGRAVVEVAQAARAVLAEAEIAVRGVGDVSAGGPCAAVLVGVRLNRLAAAAEDVIASAGSGDRGQMRCHLHRFDALTAAFWTVRQAVYGTGGPGHSAA